jgi:hypothetical protein
VPTREIRFLEASVTRAEEAVRAERFREVPAAAPRMGVMRVGVLARTTAPEPVEEVIEMFGVAPPEDASGEEAVTVVTVPKVGVVQAGEPVTIEST